MAKKVKKVKEVDVRIRQIKNGYTVTSYDNDYNDVVTFCPTWEDVIDYVNLMEI